MVCFIRNVNGGGGVRLCRIATNILNKMGLSGDWRQGVILQLATRMDNIATTYHKSSVLTIYETGLSTLQHVVKRLMNIPFPHILAKQTTVSFKDGFCPCIKSINIVFPAHTMTTL